ncbi:MAG: AI-2E family transporter, partial [Ruminococcaceae bacterium]|nr:AI-2E family transporter [Oscillospiraceae bacterium]
MFNFKKNEGYATIAFYAVAVIVASALMIYAVINMGTVWGAIEYVLSVLSPFIYGFIFAYLCNPILNFY